MANRLIHEKSPYLRQHAHNPVDWYPWGNEALHRARVENRLLLVSIGYSACHWCHVMEKESFENEQIASLMNRFFVCVKVDREERPDVDHMYMDAVQAMTGSGGWPLNVFAMPDGQPVYGGTYFNPVQWTTLLKGIQETFLKDPDQLYQFSKYLEESMVRNEIRVYPRQPAADSGDLLDRIVRFYKNNFDTERGGYNQVPKFPLPGSFSFLLHAGLCMNDNELTGHVAYTLKRMSMGGIYDQVGGGFARYSVDADWIIPHFEKMLYDNAQLLHLYSEAFLYLRDERFRRVAYEIFSFLRRELSNPEGAYFCSLDADNEGEEGKYYLWDYHEFMAAVGTENAHVAEYFHVTDGGMRVQDHILHAVDEPQVFATRKGIDPGLFNSQLSEARSHLQAYRSARRRPAVDDKIITSWNALMIRGLTMAYRSFGDPVFLEAAMSTARFIEQDRLVGDGSLWRITGTGNPSIPGFLDDYSLVIEAFITLYQDCHDERWLILADTIAVYVMEHFFDEDKALFHYSDPLEMTVRYKKKETADHVIPSSNAVMALNLQFLGQYFNKDEYTIVSEKMTRNVLSEISMDPIHAYKWCELLLYRHLGIPEVAILGSDHHHWWETFRQIIRPPVLISGSAAPSDLPVNKNRYVTGKTVMYLCLNKTCFAPVDTPGQALNRLRDQGLILENKETRGA